jgi:cyclin G-associated kinase
MSYVGTIQMARFTTPMYRAPEILETYLNYPIGPAQDIWALGCILYYLCYRSHPFEDSAKLRIINAKYTLPESETPFRIFHPLIEATLQPDPYSRPTVQDLCERIEELAIRMHVDLTSPINDLELPSLSATPQAATGVPPVRREASPVNTAGPVSSAPPPRPPPPSNVPVGKDSGQASEVFAQLKGQGISLFKNLKDKSAAVVQTVQSTYGAKGPDVTWLTARLVISPFAEGVPEALAASAEEAMRNAVLETTKRDFTVYNFSCRRLKCDYNRRLSEMPMPSSTSGIPPALSFIISICKNIITFLRRNPENFVLLTGSEAQCVLMASAVLVYVRVAEKALQAVRFVSKSRTQPSQPMPSSYIRQLELLSTVVSYEPAELRLMIHNRPVILESLYMEPLPLFNRVRTGCRPYFDVYSGGNKLWSTLKEYEQLK